MSTQKLHTDAYSSLIHNAKTLEVRKMSFNRLVDK